MEGPNPHKLKAFIASKAQHGLIDWSTQEEVMKTYHLSCFEAEAFILQNEFLPARYQRNQSMITNGQQLKLLLSHAAVIGCGGLGGYIIEELARLGVGRISVVDPDVFVEHNLNRQLLSAIDQLGQPKVDAAAQRIRQVNPVVNISKHQVALDKNNAEQILSGVDIVLDAMDNVAGRLDIAGACDKLKIPFVHGAIAGWYGQVLSVYPGDNALQKIYPSGSANKGVETQLGNPSFTPAVIASLQVAEACKALLGKGELLRHRKLAIDLLDMEFEEVPV